MECYFVVAIIDSVGGPQRMNNLLTVLYLQSKNDRSLKVSMGFCFCFQNVALEGSHGE